MNYLTNWIVEFNRVSNKKFIISTIKNSSQLGVGYFVGLKYTRRWRRYEGNIWNVTYTRWLDSPVGKNFDRYGRWLFFSLCNLKDSKRKSYFQTDWKTLLCWSIRGGSQTERLTTTKKELKHFLVLFDFYNELPLFKK